MTDVDVKQTLRSKKAPNNNSSNFGAAFKLTDGSGTFPQPKPPVAEFVPKKQIYSARETKLISLYGELGARFLASTQQKQSNEEPSGCYPLSKMSGTEAGMLNPKRQKQPIRGVNC